MNFVPILHPSGLSVCGVSHSYYARLTSLPCGAMHAATGLLRTPQCGMAEQSLFSCLLWKKLKDSSHVPAEGSGRTCWHSQANKTLLITDSAKIGHTFALTNLEDGAVVWFEDLSAKLFILSVTFGAQLEILNLMESIQPFRSINVQSFFWFNVNKLKFEPDESCVKSQNNKCLDSVKMPCRLPWDWWRQNHEKSILYTNRSVGQTDWCTYQLTQTKPNMCLCHFVWWRCC